jgi:hypothetical protein
MNWRNPFLITYLSVTVAGAAVLGYYLSSSYNYAVDIDTQYNDAVSKLQNLQNRSPFPKKENNDQYVEYTKQYRAEYDQLLARVAAMQKPLEDITPQAFQDLLRSNVSQVQEAAKENNVTLPEDFYLGFDQYRGALPSDNAAGPLARELAGIRAIVDQLIVLRVHEIGGIKRNTLPEEDGPARQAAGNRTPPRTGPGNTRLPAGAQPSSAQKVVNANSFVIVFNADQANTRSALNYIANADQFFIIRDLNIENSAQEGPAKEGDAAAAAPPADPSQPAAAPGQPGIKLLVGRETLTVSLKIEMITFNNLPTAQK